MMKKERSGVVQAGKTGEAILICYCHPELVEGKEKVLAPPFASGGNYILVRPRIVNKKLHPIRYDK
jgi:hypothetical protein